MMKWLGNPVTPDLCAAKQMVLDISLMPSEKGSDTVSQSKKKVKEMVMVQFMVRNVLLFW